MSSTTSAAPGPTTSDASTNNPGTSSPLLFFVALGFGVVFTNLWIIVGVKYCFRYNQRNRARLAGEDPDGVDLNAMPRQRRRREKKLMTIDEVNEKFPLVKYKTWRSTRADQGLPTAGGITNATSRPASIKHVPRDSQDGVDLRDKEPKTPTTLNNEKAVVTEDGHIEEIDEVAPATGSTERPATAKTLVTPPPAVVRSDTHEGDQDRDPDLDDADRIETAIPPEQLPDPGDTCAICIDTIEDDDDIRGLSCGHAFHASCVDPWLTSRRACCPLCKADYYVPKPRPEGAQDEIRRNPSNPQTPHGPFILMSSSRPGYYRRARSRPFFSGVFISSPQIDPSRTRTAGTEEAPADIPSSAPEISADSASPSWRQRISNVRMPTVPALSMIRRGRGNTAGEQPSETAEPTPAQLESGR